MTLSWSNIENPKVKAVIVGGSVARCIADRYSDVEISVFWETPPTEQDRKQVVDQYGILGHEMTLYETAPDDLGSAGADEDIYVWGERTTRFQVDVKHTVVSEIESILEQPGIGEPEVIHNALPLYGHDLVAQWKGHLAPDTDEVAERFSQRAA